MRHFSTLPFTCYVAAHLLCLTLASSLLSPQLFLGNHDAQVADNTPFYPAFDSFVDSLMSDWHIPGLAIAVVHENKTWSKVILPLVLYTYIRCATLVPSLGNFHLLCLSMTSECDYVPGLNT
jgi:hypothetical protein